MIKYETIKLKRLRKHIQIEIKKQELEKGLDIPIHVYEGISRSIENLLLHLVGDIPTYEQTGNLLIVLPKTWKDHFKIRYKDNWLIKRWIKKHPIQFEDHEYNVQKLIVFPKFKVPEFINTEKQYIEFRMVSNKERSDL